MVSLTNKKEANTFLRSYGYSALQGESVEPLSESISQDGAESQGENNRYQPRTDPIWEALEESSERYRQGQKNTAPQEGRQAAQERLSPRGESPLEDKYYARKIDQWDGKDHGGAFRIGRASKPLLAIGIPDIDIWFDQSKAAKQLEDKKEVTKSILKKIPEILANPIAVSESYDNTVMVFGQLFDESGNPIVIALRINSTNRRNSVTQVNKIRSVGTRTHNLDKLLAEESILWLGENKKETRTWFNALGRSTPFGGTKSGFVRSLSQNNQKSQGENNRYQPRTDPIWEELEQAQEADRAAIREDFQQARQVFRILDIAEKEGIFTEGSVSAVARKLIQSAGAKQKTKELTDILMQEFNYPRGVVGNHEHDVF